MHREKVSFSTARRQVASVEEAGSRGECVVHLVFDNVSLHFRHHRANRGCFVPAVSDHVLARLRHHKFFELGSDRFFHVYSLHGAADLSTVEEGEVHSVVGSLGEVRIREDNHWVLATELKHEPFQVPRTCCHDLPPRGRRTRHRHHVDRPVHQRRAHCTVALDHLDYSRRQDRLQGCNHMCPGQGGYFRGLDNDCVPSHKSRECEKQDLVCRKVPRC
mmetsp:Transcript_5948/g.17378  ORF Transcript_5948/g.17378 Transcript_5948/m.17378 type:complete len:218 (-) Transcript_5948:469-1122(-)